MDTMIGESAKVDKSADIEISDSSSSAMATAPISPVKELGKSSAGETIGSKRPLMSYGLIASGMVVYLATMMIFALSIVPLLLGWILAIEGAMLITIGTSYAYDRSAFGKKRAANAGEHDAMEKERLVLICPSCNEEVGSRDRNCPACGAKFAK